MALWLLLEFLSLVVPPLFAIYVTGVLSSLCVSILRRTVDDWNATWSDLLGTICKRFILFPQFRGLLGLHGGLLGFSVLAGAWCGIKTGSRHLRLCFLVWREKECRLRSERGREWMCAWTSSPTWLKSNHSAHLRVVGVRVFNLCTSAVLRIGSVNQEREAVCFYSVLDL